VKEERERIRTIFQGGICFYSDLESPCCASSSSVVYHMIIMIVLGW